MTAPAKPADQPGVVDLAAERRRRMLKRAAERPFAERVEEAKREILRRSGLLFVLDAKPLDGAAFES